MKIQVNKVEVGKRIFNIRKNMDLNLEQFGKIFDTSKSIVLRWENGTSLPNKIRLHKIAEKGDMSVNELLYGSVEEFVKANYFQIYSTYNTNDNVRKIIDSENKFDIAGEIVNTLEYLHKQDITINDIDELTDEVKDYMNIYRKEVPFFEKYPSSIEKFYNMSSEELQKEIDKNKKMQKRILEFANILREDIQTDSDTLNIKAYEEMLDAIENFTPSLERWREVLVKIHSKKSKTNPNQDNQ